MDLRNKDGSGMENAAQYSVRRMKLTNQPFQIDLFGISADDNQGFSNFLTFWDQIPMYFSDKSGDRSTKEISFNIKLGNRVGTWTMQCAPAQFKTKSGEEIIRFPGRLEELVMAALIDVAANVAELDGNFIVVKCYLGEIIRAMNVKGKTRCSKSELRQAISVLKKANYTLSGEPNGDGKFIKWEFSPLADTQSFGSEEGDDDDRMCFVFNRLLTDQILKLQLRLYNFDRFKRFQSVASRPVYKRLCLRFTQASVNETYNISLSTIRALAGLSTPNDMVIGKRRKPAISCLEELKKEGVIEKYETISHEKERYKGIRCKMRVVDEVYKIWPTESFAKEQKKASAIIRELNGKMTEAEAIDRDTSNLTESERLAIINKKDLIK
jgi:hypothetical protein